MPTALGTRILIWGNSCAGKSSLAQRLAEVRGTRYVDLDALNWLPNWVGLNATDPERLESRISEATAGNDWVVAGSYTKQSQATFWPRLQTIIWLDLPMWLLLLRVLRRSWQRWRSRELLWETNYENFWNQLKIWRREDSIVWWIVTQHQRKRRQTLDYMVDPRWQHIRFIRFRHVAEMESFINQVVCK